MPHQRFNSDQWDVLVVAISQTVQNETGPAGLLADSRLEGLRSVAPATHARLLQLIELAKDGLPQMHANGLFAHTVRKTNDNGGTGSGVRAEGDSLRYAINCALGLSYTDEETQRRLLDGRTAADLALQCAHRAQSSQDPGAVALAAWTAAEAAGVFTSELFAHLVALLESNRPIDTVDCSWTLIAAVAGSRLGDTRTLTRLARDRLLKGQGPYGLFPHHLPASASGRLRAHIGCFADQVYSTQGLARLSMISHDPDALAAANASGDAICRLQGPQGQWWWHYDTRNGTVVEGYPVYSVHQHAMGPMALLDLRDAGGHDHMASIARGIDWLDGPNEAGQSLVCNADNVIWRKVARHEPKKLVRAISAATTAAAPGLKVPGLDAVFRPGRIDYECRPYELGWLLFAWLSDGMKERLSAGPAAAEERPQ
ncbi:hypothetical protein L610_002100000660 [Aminobacter sp. J44]|nr:hypothetical protein L610_002100000660 [Aminobacter sp. J44]